MEARDARFWTKGRRKALSSTLLTVFQILLGGAVVGGLFGKLGMAEKAMLVSSLVVVLAIGIWAAPPE